MSKDKEPSSHVAKAFDYLVGCAQVIGTVIGIIALIVSFIGLVWAVRNQEAAIQVVRVISGDPTTTPMIVILPTSTPLPTFTPFPAYTPFPTPFEPSPIPPMATSKPVPTNTPVGMTNQVFQVKGETATWGPLETGIYTQAGDRVQINYVSGEWWIGQRLQGGSQSQAPTDANGYTGRTGDKAIALVGDDPNRCRPLISAPFGSLIGSIGKSGALFLIGNSKEFVAQDSGLLYLRINYSDHNKVTGCPYGDGGVIDVRVIVTPH